MELPPIKVNLLQFFKTGKFDFIKLGDTKELILNNCPKPDDFGIGTSLDNAKIWVYGGVELHFNDAELFLIYCDFLGSLHDSEAIVVDKWIIQRNKRLTLKVVIEQLNIENIDFTKLTNRQIKDEPYIDVIIKNSGVTLSFLCNNSRGATIANPNLYRLYSFSLMEK